MDVLDITMRAEIQKCYLVYDLSELDIKTVGKILRVNEVEGRTVSMEEIRQYLYEKTHQMAE